MAVLPAADGDPGRLIESLCAAVAHGSGDFAEVVPLASSRGDERDVLAAAANEARASGFDWLLAASVAETLAADLFVKVAPALRIHDAVWGAASRQVGGDIRIERITRLAAQDAPTFFHAALCWWIGRSHLVRPGAALAALHTSDKESWYADYMASLWTGFRAYKTAQSLTTVHGALPSLDGSERGRLLARLARDPVFHTVRYGAHCVRLPYTGLNPVIEREQMRGVFFEADELGHLAERLPHGMRIVDVGANTGNHTAFFATVMQARSVLPLEPQPEAAAAIRAVVAANGLASVDLSLLGWAVGAATGRLAPLPATSAGLGATRYAIDPDGPVAVGPLDLLVSGEVDLLKIDVEGMEMEVLAGAAALIARSRPAIFIEVLDATAGPFLAWVDANGYSIEKVFPDKSHCNYLLIAGERQ